MNVAVVLTHTRRGDRPSLEGMKRLTAGARLLTVGAADAMIIAGGLPGPDRRSLAEVYREALLRTHPVDPDRIFLETTSRDTAETLRHVPRVLESVFGAPPDRILLISNATHLRRAGRTIACLNDWRGLNVSMIPTPAASGVLTTLGERLFDLYARIDPRWQSPLAEWARLRRTRRAAAVSRRSSTAEQAHRDGDARPSGTRGGAGRADPTGRDRVLAGPIVAAVPCFNEARYVGPVVQGLVEQVDEVVVVDDGSADDTAAVARAAGARVVRHETNRGYGAALRSCFEAALRLGAHVVVTLDGDGQHDPNGIPSLIRPIAEGTADLVIGSRQLGAFRGIPGYRRAGIAIITGLYNAGSRRQVTDAQSGFRAYRREVLQALSLSETGMGASVEILVQARATGFRIAEVPITCTYHASSSTMNPVAHGVGVAWKVLEHRAKTRLSGRRRHAGS